MKLSNFIFLVLLFSCSTKVVKPKIYQNPITPKCIRLNIKFSGSIAAWTTAGLLNTSTNSYIYFIDNNHSLHYLNLFDSTDKIAIDLTPALYSRFPHGTMVRDTTLYILNSEKRIIEKYDISLISSSIKWNKTYDFKDAFLKDNVNPRASTLQYFAINDKDFFIPYSINKKSTNFTGEDVYYDLNEQEGKLIKKKTLFEFPSEFRKGDRYDKESIINFLGDSLAVCSFKTSDKILIYDLKENKYLVKRNFTEFSNYENFDQTEIQNLGYIRRYEITNETNTHIFINNLIVVIKKLRAQAITDKPEFEYYVLNKNLEIQSYAKLDLPFDIEFAFPYKKGFIIIDNSLKNSYYYEIYK